MRYIAHQREIPYLRVGLTIWQPSEFYGPFQHYTETDKDETGTKLLEADVERSKLSPLIQSTVIQKIFGEKLKPGFKDWLR